MTELADIQSVARAAVLAGGDEVHDRYRSGDDDAIHDGQDVKAVADEAAEDRMLPVIRRAFPRHTVYSEEAGEFPGEAPYRWIVDPLDGTNNFAAGLPTFSGAVAVLHNGEPVLAAVNLPATNETYVARRGSGVHFKGQLVRANSNVGVEASTVAVIVGRDVPSDPDLAQQVKSLKKSLDETVKRVIHSWAPTVHSGLFARGRIQGLVQFHPDEEEQAITELFTEEADASTHREGPWYLAASNETLLSNLWKVTTRSA